MTEAGKGTSADYHTGVIDYDIPFYHHQTLRSLLRFIHHIMSNWFSHGGNADRLLRNLADKSDLLHSLRTVIENAKAFGSYPWTSASTILSDFINNDPTSFAAISESGLITAFLSAVTGRPVSSVVQESRATQTESAEDGNDAASPESPVLQDADDRPHPPTAEMLSQPRSSPIAGGILPSLDAISVVPAVLNAICLNNTGLRMVVASRVFESYFEVFESPAHVRCMDSDYDPAGGLGRHFDELSRHHPTLRTPIANATLDMVARVCHLGNDKIRVDKWGVKLQVLDASKKPVDAGEQIRGIIAQDKPADEALQATAAAAADDSDVEMADRAEAGQPAETGSAPDAEDEVLQFEPFVFVLGNFLTTYLTNTNLKNSFIQSGGIELLLDVAESPSLSHNFGEHLASRTLQHVISGLVGHNCVLGLPSILGRTLAAIDRLSPLVQNTDSGDAFFTPFLKDNLSITADDAAKWNPAMVAKMEQGSSMARALLNAQTLIKTLCDCFAISPRSHAVSLYPMNMFDYYVAVIQSLGPLLKASLLEESAHHGLVPRHWSSNRRAVASSADEPARDNAGGTARSDVGPAQGSDRTWCQRGS